jgi:hypothetical protein
MCGAFRLARFNLQAARPVKLEREAQPRSIKEFRRSAITASRWIARFANTADAAELLAVAASGEYCNYAHSGFDRFSWVLMVSKIGYSSMKTMVPGRKGITLLCCRTRDVRRFIGIRISRRFTCADSSVGLACGC